MRAEYITSIVGGGFEAVIRMELDDGSRDAKAWFDFLKDRSSGPRELVFEDDQLVIRRLTGNPISETQSRLESFQ